MSEEEKNFYYSLFDQFKAETGKDVLSAWYEYEAWLDKKLANREIEGMEAEIPPRLHQRALEISKLMGPSKSRGIIYFTPCSVSTTQRKYQERLTRRPPRNV